MEPRHRARNTIAPGGAYIIGGVVSGHETFLAREDAMDDYYRKHRRPKPLRGLPLSNVDIYRTRRDPPVYFSAPGSYFDLVGVRPCKDNYADFSEYPWRGSGARETENDFYVYRLLADTHPFRPVFSIPNMMVEALDLADLFKQASQTFAGLIGNSYLRYRFGFSQLYSDVKTLSGITKDIESRVKEFSSLNLQGGLRRNVKLFHNSWDNTHDEVIWSTYGHFVSATYSNHRDYEIRGSVRWRWKDGVTISLTKLEAFNEAVKAVFDLGPIDASTIWNSIPWTWLADYFFDVSDWLQANENSDWVEPYDICIMRRFRSRSEWKNLNCSDGEGIGGYVAGRIKSRDVDVHPSTSLPPFRFSLLTEKQYLTVVALIGKFHGASY